MNISILFRSASFIAVTTALTSLSAQAQQQASALEEIVVTAAKRVQSLQDVSAAVTAVGTERLQTGQINNLEDIQLIVPSITFGNDFNMAKLFIRGVGANTSTTGSETGVAFHVDGVVISRAEAQLTSLFDLERVEVLRGPQGSLYGRNAVGGSVNLITAKPTEDVEGYIRGTFGNLDAITTEGAISGPVTDKLLARAAFKTQDRGGLGENPVTGSGIDAIDRRMARLQFKYLATESLDFSLAGEWYRQDDSSGAIKFLRESFPAFQNAPSLRTLGTGGIAAKPRDLASEVDPRTNTETWSVTGGANWSVNDNITIANITNYREFKTAITQDLDASAIVNSAATTGANTTVQRRDVDSTQFSNETQFKYDADWVNGVFGLFYFHEDQNSVDTVGLGPLFGQARNIDTIANLPIFPPISPVSGLERDGVFIVNPSPIPLNDALALCNVLDEADALTNPAMVDGAAPAPKRVCINTKMNTDAFAAFGQVVINMGRFMDGLESLSLKLGGRMSIERREVYNEALVLARNGAGPVLQRTAESSFNKETFRDFTPEIGLEWRATDDMMLYYTYSEGFKAGAGENNIDAAGSLPSIIVEPETIENHEAGVRSTWFDNRLSLNVTGFTYDLDGLQINKTLAGGPAGFATVFENAAKATGKGVEVEFAAQPARGVRLSGGLVYLDSTFKDFLTKDPLDPVNISGSPVFNPAAPEIQLAGNQTRNSPKWAGNVHAELDIPGMSLPAGGMLTLMGDVSYKSKIFFTEFNRLIEGSRAYAMGDINLRYSSGDDRLTADLWVKNVTDTFRAASTFALATARTIGVTYLPPRTYGFTLGYRF